MKKKIMALLLMSFIFCSSCGTEVKALERTVPSIEIDGTSYSIDDIELLENEVLEAKEHMEHSHQIAENARELEFDEQQNVIKIAQKEYNKYNNIAKKNEGILCELYNLVPEYTSDDVYLLGKIIYAEAGSNYCPDELQLMVGNVVLNRMDSGIWGSTLEDVIYAKGQYSPTFNKSRWEDISPDERSLANAERLLRGERWCPSDVIWQANFKQGKGVYWKWESDFGKMYFCY